MNDTVVISGGTRGIGAACALTFAAAGYRIALIGHTSEKSGRELVQNLNRQGTDAEVYFCDVSDYSAVQDISGQILQRFGRVDALVNNAGIAQIKLFTDLTESDWDHMMNVNAKGVFNCCRHFAPSMISRKKGTIINISSMWGIRGASCEVHYAASKAAVIGLTRSLALELAPSGIRVNAVAPGVIATEMNRGLEETTLRQLTDEIPAGYIGSPEEVAEAVLFLAEERSRYITGQILSVDGGYVV